MTSPDHRPGYGHNIATAPLLVIADRVGAAEEAAALVGRRVARWLRWKEVGGALPELACRAPLMVEAEGVSDVLLMDALPAVHRHAERAGVPVIASLSTSQIDLMVSGLPAKRVEFLCEPTVAERVAALSVLSGDAGPQTLDDSGRETERMRFRRLNEELARISDVLVRLTREEDGASVTARVNEQRAPFAIVAPDEELDITAGEVRRALRSRRMRDQFFGEGLFEDPAWDMLLDLFAAGLEGTRVSVSSLCIAAAVPPTTALRWIGKLSDARLLVRHADPSDRRRAFIGLSDTGLNGMRAYCRAIRKAGLEIA